MKDYVTISFIWGGLVAGVGCFAATTLTLGLSESFADKVARKVVDDVQKDLLSFSGCPACISYKIPSLKRGHGVTFLEPQPVSLACKSFQYGQALEAKPVDGTFDFSPAFILTDFDFPLPDMECSKRSPDGSNH